MGQDDPTGRPSTVEALRFGGRGRRRRGVGGGDRGRQPGGGEGGSLHSPGPAQRRSAGVRCRAGRPSSSALPGRASARCLYVKSPGGVLAAAARTARFRPLVERATAGTGIDANLVEAIVLLESAGRADAIAGGDPTGASGLTQIVAETGLDFLGMRVDLGASRSLTRRIERARERGKFAKALQLEAARKAIDARFVPREALAGTVRYLSAARARFGRDDLAVVSYHMGIGNLESVLRDYAPAARPESRSGRSLRADRLSYARVFFGSSPVDHAAAWRRLLGWATTRRPITGACSPPVRSCASYRKDPVRLKALADLHERKASAEEVLHPLPLTERFLTPDDVERARQQGRLQALPDDPKLTHFRRRPTSRRARATARQEPRPLPGPAPRGARAALLPRRHGPRDQRQRDPVDRDERCQRRRATNGCSRRRTPKRPPPTRCTRPATHSISSDATDRTPRREPSSTSSTGSRR